MYSTTLSSYLCFWCPPLALVLTDREGFLGQKGLIMGSLPAPDGSNPPKSPAFCSKSSFYIFSSTDSCSCKISNMAGMINMRLKQEPIQSILQVNFLTIWKREFPMFANRKRNPSGPFSHGSEKRRFLGAAAAFFALPLLCGYLWNEEKTRMRRGRSKLTVSHPSLGVLSTVRKVRCQTSCKRSVFNYK